MKLTPPRPVTPNFDRATLEANTIGIIVTNRLAPPPPQVLGKDGKADYSIMLSWAENFIAPHQPPAT